ncbi:cupin domain-containing protein [Leucobacter allii]|uniref:cupin domain-containing protein n=1 Tax=Leucobacter allii TaxID=2932247 RepID=UPI001FD21CA8|nr:cupin domain-containing protein [Leucobacter allii]UOR01355.1 cupin domain-containing protein [Leucobacter allii]
MSASPLVISDTDAPSTMLGLHGGRGVNRWKRFVTGLMLHADWDSFEHNRLDPGGAIGEHVHTRTEEVYFIVAGRGLMTLNGEQHEVGPGDLIMTPLNGRHAIENLGDDVLEFVVVEALPPEIVRRLPGYSPSAAASGGASA